MSILVSVAGTIQVADPNTSTLSISKVLSQSFTGTISSQGESVAFGTSPTSITLPINPTQVVYIANLHATNTITVTWTPRSGASAVISTIQPIGFILMAETNTTSGITALSITASGAGTPVDFFLAG